MHVLFYHQNFPAQFGHVASYLATRRGYRCTFLSEKPPGINDGVERIQYTVKGGATRQTHYCARTFENCIWHSHAAYEALKARPDIRPDLVVGHSGFGSTVFLRELYDCPMINYFEYFYRPVNSDMDFRPDFPSEELNRLRSRARNGMLLIDLENCDAGYSPTLWQRNRLPELFHQKVRVIFDGIDVNVWKPQPNLPRVVNGMTIPPGVKILTYVSRGMESMRGFDIFMQVAQKVLDRRGDVIVLVVGEDRVCYGGDERMTGKKSFKEWVLSRGNYDLTRILFLGRIHPLELARLFSLTDLHIYLTVPFVLSWSLMDALACGATVLASDTAPVCEMIRDGENGLLAGFFDVERLTEKACDVLARPADFKHLGAAGARMIRERYALDVCLPQMERLYEEVLNRGLRT